MDEVLQTEILVILLEKPRGVLLQEFAGLFYQIHGYEFKLSNYGYTSLKQVLHDMKDLVDFKNTSAGLLVKCRSSSQHGNVLVIRGSNAPQEHAQSIHSSISSGTMADAQSMSGNDISSPNTSLSALNKSPTPPIKQSHTQNNSSKATPRPTIQSSPSAAARNNPQSRNYTFPKQLPANPDISKRAKNMANFSKAPRKKQNPSTQVPNVQANFQNTSRQAKSTPQNPTKRILPPKANSGSTKQIPKAAGKPPPYSGQRQDKKTFKGVSNSISIITEKPKPPNQLITRAVPSTPSSSSMSYAAVCAGIAPGTYQAHQITQTVEQSPIFNLNYLAQGAWPVQVAHSRSRTESRSVVPVETVKENISHILKQHRGGIPILKLQKVYLFKFGKILSPCGYSTLRHFLVGMRDLVEIKGVGVQTLVFSVSSEIVSSAAKKQHDSYLLHENKSFHCDKMLPASNTSPMSLQSQKGYISEEPQNVAAEQTGALLVTARDLLSTSIVSEHTKEEGNHDIIEKDVITQDQQIVIELSDKHIPEGSVQTDLLSNSSLCNTSVVHPAMGNQTSTEVTSVKSSNHGIMQQLDTECPAAASCNNMVYQNVSEKNMPLKTDFPFSDDQQHMLILHSSGFSVVKQETNNLPTKENNEHELHYESSLNIQMGHESQLNLVHGREMDTDRIEHHTCVQDVLPRAQSQQKTLKAHKIMMPKQRETLTSNLQEQVSQNDVNYFHRQTESKLQSQKQLSVYNTISMERQITSFPETNHNAGYSNADNGKEQPFSFPFKKDQKEYNVLVNKEANEKPSLLSQIHQTPCSLSINKEVYDPKIIKTNGDNVPPSIPANIVQNYGSSESPNSKHTTHAMLHLTSSREEESPTLQTNQAEKNLSITDTMGQTVNLCSKTNQQVSKLNESVIESDSVHKSQETSNSIVKKKPRKRRSRSSRARQKANEDLSDAPESSYPPPCNGSNASKIDKPESTSDKHQSRSPSVGNNNANVMTPGKAQDQFMTSCTNNLTDETPSSSGFAFQEMQMETRHLKSNMLQQIQYIKPLDFDGKNEQVNDPLNKKAPGGKDPSCLPDSMNNSNRDKHNGSPEPTTLDTHQTNHHLYIEKISGEKAPASSETDKGKKNLSTTDTMGQTVNLCSKTNQQVSKLNESVIESDSVHKSQETSNSIVKKKPRKRRSRSSRARQKANEDLSDAPESSYPPPCNGSNASKIDKPESTSDKHQSRSPSVGNNNANVITPGKSQDQFMTSCTNNLTDETPSSSGFDFQEMQMETRHLKSNMLQQIQYIKPLDFDGKNEQVNDPLNKKAPGGKDPSCLPDSMNNSNRDKHNGSPEPTTLDTHQTNHHLYIEKISGEKASASSETDKGKKNLSTTDTMAKTVNLCPETNQQINNPTIHECQEKNCSIVEMLRKTRFLHRFFMSSPACTKTKGIPGDAPQSLHCPASHLNDLVSKAESTASYSTVHQDVSQDLYNHKASSGASTLALTQVLTKPTPAWPKTKGILGDGPQSLHCLASHHNGLVSKTQSTVLYSMVHQGVSQDLCNHNARNRATTLPKTQVLTKQTPAWPKTKGILGDAPLSLYYPAYYFNWLLSKAESTVSYSTVHQGVSQDLYNHKASNRASTLAKTQVFTEQTPACPKSKCILGDAPQSLHCPASHLNGPNSKAEATVSYSTVHQGVSQDLSNHKASNSDSKLAKTQVLTEQTPSLLPTTDPMPKDVSTWQNPADASEQYCCIL